MWCSPPLILLLMKGEGTVSAWLPSAGAVLAHTVYQAVWWWMHVCVVAYFPPKCKNNHNNKNNNHIILVDEQLATALISGQLIKGICVADSVINWYFGVWLL